MRFMLIVKATKDSEGGKMPSAELISAMGKFNEQLVGAGALQAADGLHSSSKGARVRYDGQKRTVINGPFPETEQLISGYWVLDVKSFADAVAWAEKVPFEAGEVEVRQVLDAADFPPESLSPESAAREQARRKQVEAQNAQRQSVSGK